MEDLTLTEQKIYDMLSKGMTAEEISEELHISKHTVKSYINMLNIKSNKAIGCQRHCTMSVKGALVG